MGISAYAPLRWVRAHEGGAVAVHARGGTAAVVALGRDTQYKLGVAMQPLEVIKIMRYLTESFSCNMLCVVFISNCCF